MELGIELTCLELVFCFVFDTDNVFYNTLNFVRATACVSHDTLVNFCLLYKKRTNAHCNAIFNKTRYTHCIKVLKTFLHLAQAYNFQLRFF